MRPLEGIRVLDFSQAHGASYATMLLTDFGAEVIKVEKPEAGDVIREYAPKRNGKSAYHAYMNRGKSSLSINLKTAKGREIIEKLVSTVDVVCENFRFGTMERLGLGYEELKRFNPKLIYATMTGFGRSGVLKERACTDNTAQAMSSLMDMTGALNGPPVTLGAQVGNQYGGMHLAFAINLALIHKQKTGEGQFIDVASVDSLFTILEMGEISVALTGIPFKRKGNHSQAMAPYDAFKTIDGYVSIGVSTDYQWKKFCKVMDLEHLENDPRFSNNKVRGLNYLDGLQQAIEGKTKKLSKFKVEEMLAAESIPAGAVCTLKEAAESEHIKEREMIIQVEDKALGMLGMPGISAKLYKTPGQVACGAPLLGEHNEKYLKELGYDVATIETLKKRGDIFSKQGGAL